MIPRASPWQVVLAALAGWINRHQQAAIDLLREENRVLLERLGDRRIQLTDDQRRRLAVAGKAVGRNALLDLAGLVTPDTILAWHRTWRALRWPTSWRTFLGAHGSTIAAIDFTTVEVWGRHGLVTMYVRSGGTSLTCRARTWSSLLPHSSGLFGPIRTFAETAIRSKAPSL